MDEIEAERRMARVEDRAKSNSHRLDKLEPIVQEIHTMSKTMVQLVEEVKHTNETVQEMDEKIDQLDNRVNTMEREPAEEARNYKRVALTAVISTIAGAAATGLVTILLHYI